VVDIAIVILGSNVMAKEIVFALLSVTERLVDVMMVVVENAIVVLDSNA